MNENNDQIRPQPQNTGEMPNSVRKLDGRERANAADKTAGEMKEYAYRSKRRLSHDYDSQPRAGNIDNQADQLVIKMMEDKFNEYSQAYEDESLDKYLDLKDNEIELIKKNPKKKSEAIKGLLKALKKYQNITVNANRLFNSTNRLSGNYKYSLRMKFRKLQINSNDVATLIRWILSELRR